MFKELSATYLDQAEQALRRKLRRQHRQIMEGEW